MKKIVCFLTFMIFLLGCGSSKQIPDWTNISFNQLENYKKSYLIGKDNIAELHFNRAVDEIKKSGDLEVLEKAYLTKYAVQVSVLESFDDREYLAMESIQPVLQNSNFYLFLKGSFDKVDEKLLPRQYSGFLSVCRNGKSQDIMPEIAKMDDPLSKLITIGLLVRNNTYDEDIIKIAIDAASKNGWKKALLAYFYKLQYLYETKKDMEKADAVRQKINLIKK